MRDLEPCPNKPNCVSSKAEPSDRQHFIEPLTLPEAGWEAVVQTVSTMPRTEVVEQDDGFLHVVFTTALMRFRDDVHLVLDDDGQTVHVRSASRVGYGDLGANRKRVEAIRAALSEAVAKRILIGIVLVVVVIVATFAAALASAFVGVAPLEDGQRFAGGRVQTIVDGYVACFLVDAGDDRWVLVDACMDPEGTAVREALADRGLTVDDLSVVLLTHSHTDHVDGLQGLGDVPVRALGAAIPYLEGRKAHRGPLTRLMGASDSGVRVRQPLSDTEIAVVGDTEFQVFSVPGHTAGSAAYLALGVLFLGDSARAKEDGSVAGAPWVFSDDVSRNLASLRTLPGRMPRPVRVVLPAHTGPIDDLASLGTL